MQQKEEFYFEGYKVIVTRKESRNMYLRISPKAELFISAPRGMEKARIEEFLQRKTDWILQKMKLIQQQAQNTPAKLEDGVKIPLWGKWYTLKLEYKGARSKVSVLEDRILMQCPENAKEEMVEKALLHFYSKELEKAIPQAFAKWEKVVGKFCMGVTIKNMRSRWGSCNVRTAQITLNVQLAKKPPECLDYVVVHELTHLWEANHGPNFKALMSRFYPDWKAVKKILNEGAPQEEMD